MTRAILVEYRAFDGIWRELAPRITPDDLHGSGTAIWHDELVLVVFGWDDQGVPRVWRHDAPTAAMGTGARAHLLPPESGPSLADLRDGPYELAGLAARWRWTLVER